MVRWAKYAATNQNLREHAVEPLMRWLIAVALDGGTVTYGAVKHRLEHERSFSTIFPTRIGYVAGALMNRIHSVEPHAPLINVLVVGQQDGQPGEGAQSFLAARFKEPRLKRKGAKRRHPDLWEDTFSRAADEVYAYSREDWTALYRRVFKSGLATNEIERERDLPQQGTESDGLRYGRRGEGPEHEALRLWITQNPHRVHHAFAKARTDTEVDLYSGDRIDAVYYCGKRTIVLEVKSRISNYHDLHRGVFQCVKYRAVKRAMDVRPEACVEAFLVTESPLPKSIKALLTRHKIKHYNAPQKRKA